MLTGEPEMLLSPKTEKAKIRKNPPCFVPMPPPLKACACQQPAEPSRCCRVRAERFKGFLQFLPLANVPAPLYLSQFGCQVYFKYTSLIPLCSTSRIRPLRKKRNMEFGSRAATCKNHRGRQTKESLYIFCFSTDIRSLQAAAISLIRHSE